MPPVKSAQRQRFEKDAFPHLGGLWETALWLTMRGSSAEDLVLRTMTQAYCSWHGPNGTAGDKARLFRILVREFFDPHNGKRNSDRIPPEHLTISTNSADGGRSYSTSSVDREELSLLTGMSRVFVRGTIARLGPQSRLMMVLLFYERFSYSEIAYITDLQRDSVRSVLARLRRLIPRYLIEHPDCLAAATYGRTSIRANGVPLVQMFEPFPYSPPGMATRESGTNAAADSWENEGGALHSLPEG